MPIKSHIQLPKGILKQFRESSGRVFYLDIEKKAIGLAGADILGTKFGYFSDEMEQYLNREIETPLTTLAAKVRAFVNGDEETLTLPMETESVLKKYTTAAMARSDLAINTLMKRSLTADLCTSQENHDDLVYISTQQNAGVVPAIGNYTMSIVINHTTKRLVVPRNCFYTVSSCGVECIVAPISPVCALELLPEDYTGNVVDSERLRLGYIDDPTMIETMNIRALSYEYVFNKCFVASDSKSELEQLKSFLEKYENILEAQREEALL